MFKQFAMAAAFAACALVPTAHAEMFGVQGSLGIGFFQPSGPAVYRGAQAPYYNGREVRRGYRGGPHCDDPVTPTYVPSIRRCVGSADVAEIEELSPDLAVDPRCKHAGDTYDVAVIGPGGRRGISHRVCGNR